MVVALLQLPAVALMIEFIHDFFTEVDVFVPIMLMALLIWGLCRLGRWICGL